MMSKQIVNLIGILVSVGVLALGVFLVAMPLATQALGIFGQAQQVAQTNSMYQAQVDSLNKAKENKAQIDASVAALRLQIPASPQLDEVFDLVARASEASGATISSMTAGTVAPFVGRTGATSLSDQKAVPTPAPSPSATATAQSSQPNGNTDATAGTSTTASGPQRSQIDFAISVSATDMNQVTTFLDGLRGGPRLLSNITSIVVQSSNGIQVQVSALTYVDGSTPTVATGAK